MTDTNGRVVSFDSLGLHPAVAAVAAEQQYVTPTAIQAETIPQLLAGRDVLGQADTGTGKTAAFAMPLLSRVDPQSRRTQVLVLTPTRELAIQVARSFAVYGRNLPNLNVQAVYGGAPYGPQIRELQRGIQIVVGTPGRVMDHMRRGALDLSGVACMVLDEADEMLRMGFVEDVTWILEQTPAERQIALFSATMPEEIRRIADVHLRQPAVVQVQQPHSSDASIRARYLITPWRDKSRALLRVLETEDTDAVIVFAKTRETTLRVAEELLEQGYAAIAINGDIPQKQREHTIAQLRSGKLRILVATDVAARGLDVPQISHVINYDLPTDNQTWVHRIGRTGRAGRSGEAILFISYRERRRLKGLERESRQRITELQFPSNAEINRRRQQAWQQRVTDALHSDTARAFRPMVETLLRDSGASAGEIGAAIAAAMHGDAPFLLPEAPEPRPPRDDRRAPRATPAPHTDRPTPEVRNSSAPRGEQRNPSPTRPPHRRRPEHSVEPGMERFRIEVGHEHGVQPGNIVGAIANEAGLDSRNIGRIEIHGDHSFVDLPDGMPKPIFRGLKDVVVLGRHLRITRTVPYKSRKAQSRNRRPDGEHQTHRQKRKGPAPRSPRRESSAASSEQA